MSYCSGFFKEAMLRRTQQPTMTYDFLKTILIEDEWFDLYQFLHGYCDEFAYYQAMKQGYSMVVWYQLNEITQCFELIHVFNQFERDGVTHYMDIRGVTTEIKQILEDFEGHDYQWVKCFHQPEAFVQFMQETYQEYYRPLKIGEIEFIDQQLSSYYHGFWNDTCQQVAN